MRVLFGMMFLIASAAASASAKTIRYDLEIRRISVNLSGKKTVDWALAVNGSIPAPALEFTEGDDAEITVKNGLPDEEVSIHWHGILLPPEMDGVAYVNTPPIHPGGSFTFKFRLRQHGTYWYHSHTMLQEQKGVFGAFVVHPKTKTVSVDHDVVAVLSDWSDENADRILRHLRKDGEYYQYKKKSVRSWAGAIRAGRLGTMLKGEWDRMGGMDLSDVGYDAFLINGKRDSQLVVAHPGETVRLRIINAAASSYFHVSLGGLPMKVISADGVDVEPVRANELLMGMAETYDVLFEVPEHQNYELRATAQDVTGFASAWIGMGGKVPAPAKAAPDLYAPMDHGAAHANHAGPAVQDSHAVHHGGHHDHHASAPAPKKVVEELRAVDSLTVDGLRAAAPTAFPTNAPVREMKLILGGDMERYVWHVNGKAIHEDRTIEIREGDIVRFVFVNETMMHHPMHLHGHFFRVLTGAGERSPLKHTVDVPPHGTRTIEFLANEPGEWMLHCHNLYHMKTGMARVVKYLSYEPKPGLAEHRKHDPHLHDHLYFAGSVEAATDHAKAGLRLSRTWDELELRAENRGFEHGGHAEGDLLYRRWLSNFLNLVAGGTHAEILPEDRTRAVIGVGGVLPMLIEANLLFDHKGEARLDLEKRFQWTEKILSDFEVSFRERLDPEYEVTLMYANSWEWAMGLTFTENRAGAGLRYRF